MAAWLGERIRDVRLRRGLSQAVLAQLVGRSERWLIDVEQGRVDLKVSDALKLARELRIGVGELLSEGVPEAASDRGPRRQAGRRPLRVALAGRALIGGWKLLQRL
jgi:transcriptional regulator with XRE-family HTH domain